MAQGTGKQTELRLGFETVYGTTPGAPTTYTMPYAPTLDFKQTRSLNNSAVIIDTVNPGKPFSGYKDVTGSVSVPVDTVAFGWWMKAAFNDAATTGTDPYTHVFTVNDSAHSLFIEKAHTDLTLYYLYNGVKLNSFDLNFGGDGELLANLSFMGQKETKGTSEVVTPTDITSTNFGNFEVSLTGATNVKSVSLNYTNNLDGGSYTIDNGDERGDIPKGMVGVSGTLEALYDDDTLLAAARDQTEQTLTITLDNATESIEFQIGELLLEETGVAVDTPQGLTQKFNFIAYYENHADASALQVTVINSQATY